MSALTERRQREIMESYQRIRVPRGILLSIFYDANDVHEIPNILRRIGEALRRMTGIDSSTLHQGTNPIVVTAQWTESDTELRVEELRRIQGVANVQARIIEHGIAGPRVIPPASPASFTFPNSERQ
jgi:hypothetical protein